MLSRHPTGGADQESLIITVSLENKNMVMQGSLAERIWGYDFAGETNVVDVYIRYAPRSRNPSAVDSYCGGRVYNQR